MNYRKIHHSKWLQYTGSAKEMINELHEDSSLKLLQYTGRAKEMINELQEDSSLKWFQYTGRAKEMINELMWRFITQMTSIYR